MRTNVIKAKDEYAKSCGAEDWYDHINGMSARDVELEMEYVFEEQEKIYHNFLLRLYENTMYGDGKMYDKLISYYYNATNSNAGEEQKDLTEILK